MGLKFPGMGSYGLIECAWWEVSSPPISEEEAVQMIVRDRMDFERFRPTGEVGREWKGEYGFVLVRPNSFEEIVKVRRSGSYHGAGVYQRGPVRDDGVMVGLTSNDPREAARLGFGGDQRLDGFDKDIAPEEFEDVVEEVTVRYRRGEGVVRG